MPEHSRERGLRGAKLRYNLESRVSTIESIHLYALVTNVLNRIASGGIHQKSRSPTSLQSQNTYRKNIHEKYSDRVMLSKLRLRSIAKQQDVHVVSWYT